MYAIPSTNFFSTIFKQWHVEEGGGVLHEIFVHYLYMFLQKCLHNDIFSVEVFFFATVEKEMESALFLL